MAAAAAAGGAEPPRIVPNPEAIEVRAGELAIGTSTAIVARDADPAAREVAAILADLLQRSYGVRLPVRNTSTPGAIELRRIPADGRPEAYRVEVGPAGAVLSGASQAALMHAATTFWQLVSRSGGMLAARACVVQDAPRFAWRGIMLDSARHYQSPRFVRRFIDWMAVHKLNVLHWHLTDDQAWRLEIRKYPRLTSVGAWRVPAGAAREDIDPATGKPRRYGGYYPQEVVKSLVAYAAARGITIVPEIDIPGHATAAIAAYPHLAAADAPPREVPADWGIYPNVFNLEERTFSFLEDVLAEVLALFPGRYIHVGGDEVEKHQWAHSARAAERMRELGIADAGRVQPYFTQRIARFLQARGRRLVGWDEILEPGLARNAVVMSWRGIDGALAAAAKGHDTVLAAHPTLYFDHRQRAARGEPPGRMRVVSLADVYAFEPMPAAIAPDRRRHVLGLQGNVWTEHIRTEERVAWMTFPRAAAVAELGWSQPHRRGFADFTARMQAMYARYDALGIPYAREVPEPALPAGRRASHDLKLCSEHIAIALEDDAPFEGARAVFAVDVQNPCWIYPQAALGGAAAIEATVGQVPFNFQIGDDVKKVVFPPARSAEGELEVRLGSCEGEVIARLPLAPATKSPGVTKLAAAPIPELLGRHDLCLRFAQPKLDPLWVIDSVAVTGTAR